ncbi:MAG TPA: hypothetical protein P5571_14165 [Candidatus Krumholzibacteria bacterium]|nr:hypothetical protein [Candidatus Krumholzibacteria bacterium]
MRRLVALLSLLLLAGTAAAQSGGDFVEKRVPTERKELTFIGYYFVRTELSNVAPTNEFLKGQVVGRIFGGNTTRTSSQKSRFSEQRFMPMFTYTPRLFDGWAKMRASLEMDWTWGDANYGAGGNFGGAFGADFANIQTQNLFMEFNPNRANYVNLGLLRLYDSMMVPYYTPTDHLVYKGYRLAMFGSDASGVQWFRHLATDRRIKLGAYQLYENNVEQTDDVTLYEAGYEMDLDLETSFGVSLHHLVDRGNGEGGVSILGQGLNSGLSNYNGVFNFNLGNEAYTADVNWLGTFFHRDPLLLQGNWGLGGFAWWNTGTVDTATRSIDINGLAANLRVAHRWGAQAEDQIALDGLFTTGDADNVSDGTYNGVLTGNNWGAPGAVFFSHGLYLLLPHGNVVNRFNAAVIDVQNLGYGFSGGSLTIAKEIVPNKFRVKVGGGAGWATKTPTAMGSFIGSELNINLRYRPKVFMDLELHAARLWLGDFYDSTVVNGGSDTRPMDPWTIFATLKWIMF